MSISTVPISNVPISNVPASIIVVNFNGLEHLPPLFAALALQTRKDFDLIFVDNGSTDGSITAAHELGRAYGISTRVICNESNLGFAPACNQGIDASSADYLVLLNNDTRPEPPWLENLIHAVESAPDVGMAASKMLFAHQPEMINSAGIALDRTGIAWDWRGGEMDDTHESEMVEVFGPCGGAALYTRIMLDEIGGFDDDFFMYLEDVDLAWRARLAGWRCLLHPQARVLHAHSATSGEGSPFKSYQLGRNKIWLLAKNSPESLLSKELPAIVAYDVLATLYGWATRGDAALVRGRFDGLRQLPRFLEKRRVIQKRWQDVDNWSAAVYPAEAPWAVSQRYSHLAPGQRRPSGRGSSEIAASPTTPPGGSLRHG